MTPGPLNVLYTVPLRYVRYKSDTNVLWTLVAIHADQPSVNVASGAFSLN